jgi:hypothetical protein
MAQTWRDWLAPIIAEVIAEGEEGETYRELRKRLRAARPRRVRITSHGTKIWNDEILRQLGKKPPLGSRKPKEVDARQESLL